MRRLFSLLFATFRDAPHSKVHWQDACARRAFTLLELLAVLTIIAVAATLLVPAVSGAMDKTKRAKCLSKMRSLGLGIRLYSQDHDNEFPRSIHSAGAHDEANWPFQIYVYLGEPEVTGPAAWTGVFNRHFRCPSDTAKDFNIPSYALNVFFELSPERDSYVGRPATWRKTASLPQPSRTVILGEPRATENGDHFMCHEWSNIAAARNAMDSTRHAKTSNYLFADGHVASLKVEETFDPSNGRNLWNPSLAK